MARRGFTLIEMLIVLSVVGLLAAMLVVGLTQVRRVSQRSRCMHNLAQIGQLLILHAGRSNGYLPMLDEDSIPWYVQLQRQAGPEESLAELFICPSQSGAAYRADDPAWTSDHISYGLNADVKDKTGCPYRVGETNFGNLDNDDRQPDRYAMSEIAVPGQFILVAESDQRPGGANYAVAPRAVRSDRPVGLWHSGKGHLLFADGHVQLYNEEINWDEPIITALWTLPAD